MLMNSKQVHIIGCGIVGCVLAHELAIKGKKVTIYERREHTGGNIHDYVDNYGIRVHRYGPHIFHTKKREIYEYILKFCRMEEFKLICGAVIDNQCVPTAFNFTAVDMFFSKEKADLIKSHIQRVYGNQKSATVLDMLQCEDELVKEFAQFLYDKDYKLYTAKQWGISPEEIDKQVLKRVPIRFSYESTYFEDEFQAMPVNGYMELIHNLLNHSNIEIQLNCNALELFDVRESRIYKNGQELNDIVIYTGALDELFKGIYGKLPYRSLRFEWKHEDVESFQDLPVVAYPQAAGFTRITEYKKLPIQNSKGTTYAIEYPLPYKKEEAETEPYYPVLTDESKLLFEKYRKQALEIKNLYCCGRLADFKYYDIDQAVERALEVSLKIK